MPTLLELAGASYQPKGAAKPTQTSSAKAWRQPSQRKATNVARSSGNTTATAPSAKASGSSSRKASKENGNSTTWKPTAPRPTTSPSTHPEVVEKMAVHVGQDRQSHPCLPPRRQSLGNKDQRSPGESSATKRKIKLKKREVISMKKLKNRCLQSGLAALRLATSRSFSAIPSI